MMRPHGAAGRLARRAPFAGREALGQAAVLAQAHARGNGIGQWDSAARRLRGLRRTLRPAAPAIITLVRPAIGPHRVVLQGREHQQCNAAESEQVNSGDPEHEGSPAHGARLAHS